MDFLTLPPEVNSARMYTGPGAEPMLAAAESWQTLAAELYSAANSHQSVVSGLTAGPWQGPSSATMAAAAASYAAWMSATARQAEQTASQARVAADAYQTAFAATVPPQAVAANRSLLTRLVATNLFGQNTSAIATTEAQYAEMWTQDAVAMSGYSSSAASATTLTPFTAPRQNTDPGGSASQSTAVGQATGTSAGNAQSAVSSIEQAFSAVPNALAAPAAASSSSSSLDTAADLISIFLDLPADVGELSVDVPLSILGLVSLPIDIGSYGTGLDTDDIVSGWNGVQPWPNDGAAPVKELPAPLTNPSAGHGAASAELFGRSGRSEPGRNVVVCAGDRTSPHRRPPDRGDAACAAGYRRRGRPTRSGRHAQPDGAGQHGRASHRRNDADPRRPGWRGD